jgi:hypothetical protein
MAAAPLGKELERQNSPDELSDFSSLAAKEGSSPTITTPAAMLLFLSPS